MITLRPYQDEAIKALKGATNGGVKSPLVCLPTGSGKTPVLCRYLADLAKEYPNERFLVCVHTKELVKQIHDTMLAMCGIESGIISASLKKKQRGKQISVVQVQTFFRDKSRLDRYHTVIIDECDRVPDKGKGQYQTLIKDLRICNPNIFLIGLTATPYRMKSGLCYGGDQMFSSLVYDAGIKELMEAGYLAKLVSKDGGKPDLRDIHIRNGDYAVDELQDYMSDASRIKAACREIIKYGADRNKWLIFACGVEHARLVSRSLTEQGYVCPTVVGETNGDDRDEYVTALKSGVVRGLVNVNVLSVGFDAPDIDLIVLLRPTKSPGLYYQQMGRGLRIHPSKQNTMVLDLAGNISEHGPVDLLNERIKRNKSAKDRDGVAPTKTCPNCSAIILAGLMECGDCGYVYPPIEKEIAKHDVKATEASPISTTETTGSWAKIESVHYRLWTTKKGDTENKSVRIDYHTTIGLVVSHFISLNESARYFFNLFVAKAENKSTTIRLSSDGFKPIATDGTTVDHNNIVRWFHTLRTPHYIRIIKSGAYYQVKGIEYDEAATARRMGLQPNTVQESAGPPPTPTDNGMVNSSSSDDRQVG